MKKTRLAIATGLVMSALMGSSPLFADPGLMVGVNINTNGELGFSLHMLTSGDENTTVASAGMSFVPTDPEPIGLMLGVGQNFDSMSIMGSWDFIHKVPQIGVGYIDTDND